MFQVIDEAHLLSDASSTAASKLGSLSRYQAGKVWLVTGTPFSTELRQLVNQAQLLGQYEDGVRLRELFEGQWDPRTRWPPQPGDGIYPRYQMYSQGSQGYYGYGVNTPAQVERQVRPRVDLTNDAVVDRMRSVMIRHTKSSACGELSKLGHLSTRCR